MERPNARAPGCAAAHAVIIRSPCAAAAIARPNRIARPTHLHTPWPDAVGVRRRWLTHPEPLAPAHAGDCDAHSQDTLVKS